MKFEDFEHQLVVSAFVVAFATLMKAGGGISPMFALALFVLSQAGYFALSAIKKSGERSPNAEYVVILVTFACFFAAALSFSSLTTVLPFTFVPLIFCTPAVVGAAKTYVR